MKTATATAEDRTLPASASAVFEPETILPSQLLDRDSGASLQPEKRLMLAVLEEAVATLQRYAAARGRAAERQFEDARQWLFADDLTWTFSFVNICHALGLEPAYVRSGLERWLTTVRTSAANGKVVPFRYQFRRIGGSRTRAVVPRALR